MPYYAVSNRTYLVKLIEVFGFTNDLVVTEDSMVDHLMGLAR